MEVLPVLDHFTPRLRPITRPITNVLFDLRSDCWLPEPLPSPLTGFDVPNLTYIFAQRPWYSALVVPSIKGANHGMDRTEARRDRPQLRNQLVRERRALIEFHFLRLPLSVSKSATAAF